MSTRYTPTPVAGVRRWSAPLPPIPVGYDRLELLYEIQTLLAQSSAIEQACDALLPVVTQTLRVRTVILLDTTPEIQRAYLWVAEGIAPPDLDDARQHALDTLEYLVRGGIESTNVVSRTALLPGGVGEQAVADRVFVTLPLVVRGHVFGVFQLEGAFAFDERDLLFINLVVNQLAVALDRRHVELQLETSRADLERANQRLLDLQAIGEAALEGATLDGSLAAVLRAICSMFATDAAAVLLASEDGKTLRCRASIGLDDVDGLEIPVGAGTAGKIVASGAAMRFDDVDRADTESPLLRASGFRSVLGAPMRARNHLAGVVYVASRDRRGFPGDALQLLALVAGRIGTIIDNATLYERALSAVRSRDVVLGIVSHDLRNPLSAIHMCAEILATDDPRLAKPVSIIKNAVDVMIRLISDLQDIGSIEAGHLSIKKRREDACALVRDAIESVQVAASKRAVHLEARPFARELALDCDRVRVIQVLSNLLSNAIKFTPAQGSITIAVTEEPSFVRFSVADNGVGIPESDLAHVFDRYWQAEGTAQLGTGLGLAIAKGIVEAHRGVMSVESNVGHGTTFSFTLPLG